MFCTNAGVAQRQSSGIVNRGLSVQIRSPAPKTQLLFCALCSLPAAFFHRGDYPPCMTHFFRSIVRKNLLSPPLDENRCMPCGTAVMLHPQKHPPFKPQLLFCALCSLPAAFFCCGFLFIISSLCQQYIRIVGQYHLPSGLSGEQL